MLAGSISMSQKIHSGDGAIFILNSLSLMKMILFNILNWETQIMLSTVTSELMDVCSSLSSQDFHSETLLKISFC